MDRYEEAAELDKKASDYATTHTKYFFGDNIECPPQEGTKARDYWNNQRTGFLLFWTGDKNGS